MKRLFIAALVLVLILSGCTFLPVPSPMPAYVVVLTPDRPISSQRCTGVALDERTILTAWHCVDNARRATTVTGQMVGVISWALWPEHDAALMRTLQPLQIPEFGELGVLDTGKPATVHGACPAYFLATPRHMIYDGWSLSNFDGTWRVADAWHVAAFDQYICGGDSGGGLIQDGKVVGILSALYRGPADKAGGQQAYSVSSRTIQILMEQHAAKKQAPRPELPDIQRTCLDGLCR